MASATATANPDVDTTRRPSRAAGWPVGSRLGRLIIALNLVGLAILIAGALVLNELRRGLVDARIESLNLEGQVIVNVLNQSATVGEPEPQLQADTAETVLQNLYVPRTQRVRLYDADAHQVYDSFIIADHVEVAPLPPARKPGEKPISLSLPHFGPSPKPDQAARELSDEVSKALRGEAVHTTRLAESGKRVVSVSIPIEHVREVLGVLTLEAGDVDEIIAAERAALIPFALIAVAVTLLSSLLLTQLVARPILRLAAAADRVRLSRARTIDLPDLADRNDEIGDLTKSITDMTQALSDRIDAIESFAADVAHEIRNPLTSIRSATETLHLVKDDAPREKLMGILKQDVGRLDRLITDISNASRLDAELARDTPRNLDLAHLLHDIVSFYDATTKPEEAHVRLLGPATGPEPTLVVMGREGPLNQVFRNLIDNAKSFSPPGGEVRVSLSRARGDVLVTVEDDGPGMPPENLETVFQRFYTSRPKGRAFGGNSGLGLSIARQIVQAHKGRIWAENRADEADPDKVIGARFVVALPAA
jgi:two-component system sensor histidine kinase ChvG